MFDVSNLGVVRIPAHLYVDVVRGNFNYYANVGVVTKTYTSVRFIGKFKTQNICEIVVLIKMFQLFTKKLNWTLELRIHKYDKALRKIHSW